MNTDYGGRIICLFIPWFKNHTIREPVCRLQVQSASDICVTIQIFCHYLEDFGILSDRGGFLNEATGLVCKHCRTILSYLSLSFCLSVCLCSYCPNATWMTTFISYTSLGTHLYKTVCAISVKITSLTATLRSTDSILDTEIVWDTIF